MRKGRSRVLFMSVLTILLCVSMLAAETYALFSDRQTVKNHLLSGTLDVTLTRTKLEKTYLDGTTGYLTTATDTEEKDFTDETAENVFGIGTDEKIVPMCSYTATLRIDNKGDTAFDYEVVIELTGDAVALSEQLSVTVNGESRGHLSDYLTDGQAALVTSGTLLRGGQSETFTVTVGFDNLEDDVNNAAKNQTVSFDLIVRAVQRTAA